MQGIEYSVYLPTMYKIAIVIQLLTQTDWLKPTLHLAIPSCFSGVACVYLVGREGSETK